MGAVVVAVVAAWVREIRPVVSILFIRALRFAGVSGILDVQVIPIVTLSAVILTSPKTQITILMALDTLITV